MSLGKRTKGARLARNFTNAAEFARTVGVSKQYLANIEQDRVEKPDVNQIVRIARGLGVTVDWLATGAGLPERETLDINPDEHDIVLALRAVDPAIQQVVLDILAKHIPKRRSK